MNEAQAKLLVTGAGGFIGRAIVSRLASDGRAVIALGRTTPPAPAGVVARAIGDMMTVDWPAQLRDVDCVVHCAALAHVQDRSATALDSFMRANCDTTLTLARASADAGVRRLIFLSSIGVHGDRTTGRPFHPDDRPAPHSPYAVAKWEAERGLAEIAGKTGLEIVVVRPPLVLGHEPSGNLGSLVSAMRRELPLPLGAITGNRRDLVSVETLADLVTRAIDHPGAPGAPLLISDGHALSTRDIVERLAQIHRLTPRLLSVPPVLLRAILMLVGRGRIASQLLGDLEVDIADTSRRLEWQPARGMAA